MNRTINSRMDEYNYFRPINKDIHTVTLASYTVCEEVFYYFV